MSQFSIKPPISSEKNLVYRGKNYPINFSTLKKYSNFFYSKRKSFKSVKNVELSEISNISEDSIQNFISCCQNESFIINDDNVFSLQQLSIQYEVPELLKITNEYINEHHENLIFQSILFKIHTLKGQIQINSLQNDEEIISSNFFKYINNEQMLNLPIPVLYRIIDRSYQKLSDMNDEHQNQIIEFLFKCLNKHHREASVLFSIIDFGDVKFSIFSRLIDQYSEIFDFGMLNSEYLVKTTSQILSELNKVKFEFTNKINELNQLIEYQKELLQKTELKMEQQEENNKKQFDSFLNSIKEERQKEREELQNSFNQLKQQTKDEIEQLKIQVSQLTKEIERERNKHKKYLEYNGDHFSGCFNYLRKKSSGNIDNVVNITASTYRWNDEDQHQRNVTLFDNDEKVFFSEDKPNSWICFDFKNRRIAPLNYTIKTAQYPWTINCHPKSWVIECSTDNDKWETVDEVNNSSDLNGENRVHTFPIKNPSSKEFQYIRMRQTDKTWSNQDYLIINSFELFGILVSNPVSVI